MNPLSEEEYYYKLDNMVLISGQHLRTLFQARWKRESGLDWEQTEKQGHEFINGLGQMAYNKAMNAQKGIIAKGCLDDWDISVLSTVLLNFGDWRTYKSENVSVRQLTTLRNDMAHHPSKKLTLEEYNKEVDLFRSSMQGVGMKHEEVEQVIAKAGRSSSVAALKSTKRLYDRARGLIKRNKFEQAIGCYDEAITMPSLLPIHQATAFEKRAQCYIKYAQHKKEKQLSAEIHDYCDQAVKDASRALEIKEDSWQAYFTMAQAHRLKGELEKAQEHYQHSLAISPAERDVKNELASCKGLLSIKEGAMTHLECLPKNLSEKVAEYSRGAGRNITEKEFLETMGVPKEMADKIPGFYSFVRAHQYRCGWGVCSSEIEAVRYFKKSADEGYSEGIHSLGVCYDNGEGVAQDATKAFELFLKAAQMSPTSSGRTTLANKNRGVAAAQESLGKMYEHGLVVEEDFVKAAEWLAKAAENGQSYAAYRLGVFYMNGWGVPRNEKLAELQWIQAVRFKEAEAAYALVLHYKHHMEPEKAFNMFKVGRLLRHTVLNGISDEELMVEITAVTERRNELAPELMEFESQHQLGVKGFTFMQRLRRMKNFADGKTFTFSSEFPSTPRGDDWRACLTDIDNIAKWEESAKNGSVVAAEFLNALEASSLVMDMIAANKIFKDEKTVELINGLYDIATNEYRVGTLPDDMLQKIKKPLADFFRSQHGKKGEMDMKARLCFVAFNLKTSSQENIARGIELIKEGLKMYPDNVNYYVKLCRLYGAKEDFESGFTITLKGLEKFPDNLQLLLFKALQLDLLTSKMENKEHAIKAFKDFVDKAPTDYPDVPGIYYRMAELDLENPKQVGFSTSTEMYFKLGEEAEKKILLYSFPFKSCPVKGRLEAILGAVKPNAEIKALCQSQAGKTIVQAATSSATQLQELGVLQQKLYLSSPVRKRLMLSQRMLINEMIPINVAFGGTAQYVGQRISLAVMIQQAPNGLAELMPITLTEMSPTTETIYQNCSIDLTIIDEPNIKLLWVQLVAEDDNGDVVLVFIHKMDRTLTNFRRLKFGRRISILNPYMQVRDLDTDMGIRVDDEDCLVFLGGVKDMCRFCGVEGAQFRCGKCKKALYCSKECQEHDCKMMEHKLICSYIKNSVLYKD